MSRTRKGKKGVGFEYWSRRPYSCHSPGSEIKKLTHKVERQDGKKIILKEQKLLALLMYQVHDGGE